MEKPSEALKEFRFPVPETIMEPAPGFVVIAEIEQPLEKGAIEVVLSDAECPIRPGVIIATASKNPDFRRGDVAYFVFGQARAVELESSVLQMVVTEELLRGRIPHEKVDASRIVYKNMTFRKLVNMAKAADARAQLQNSQAVMQSVLQGGGV